MPSNLDDDDELVLKFEDCVSCRFRLKPRICGGCGAGEEFEPVAPKGVDRLFHS